MPDSAPAGPRERLASLDLLRGVVMIVMALDHVRDFFSERIFWDPVDLKTTTSGIFFTRWITHFCAPVFIFLAGTGAFLAGVRGKARGELSWFLFTRGLFFAIFEITVNRASWMFNWSLYENGAGTFWAIGLAMMTLSLLVWFPLTFIGVFGAVLVALHNTLDGLTAADAGMPPWLWMILHAPPPPDLPLGHPILIPGVGKVMFNTGYCYLPWTGTMALGYCLGALMTLEPRARKRELLGLGAGLTLAFILLRATNVYGDPSPWSKQASDLFTLASFLNCTKYPASSLYLLMTLGPAILFLALFDRVDGEAPLVKQILVFGRVPFFFYILHIPLIHGAAVLVDWLRFGWSPLANNGPWFKQHEAPPGYGLSLPWIYLIWLVVVVILYFPCLWYADLKRRRRDLALLSYL